jgi:hypothetical protein
MLRISSGLVAAVVLFGTIAVAQTAPSPNAKAADNRAYVQDNASCQKIVSECKSLGYVVGAYKQDNGLWRDCFDPILHGQTPTRKGKPMKVAVSPSEVQECRAAGQQAHAR